MCKCPGVPKREFRLFQLAVHGHYRPPVLAKKRRPERFQAAVKDRQPLARLQIPDAGDLVFAGFIIRSFAQENPERPVPVDLHLIRKIKKTAQKPDVLKSRYLMNISANKPGIGDVPDLYPIFTDDQKPVRVFKRDGLDRSSIGIGKAERAVKLEKFLISLSKK